jgi:hypothetical protein
MSDDITRAIDWVGCTTNSPAHTHEIRTDALKALADLRTNLAAANARAEDAEQRLRVQEKWIGRAEAAEARERVKDELLKDTRPFCYGCAYVKDGRLADRYATKKGNE